MSTMSAVGSEAAGAWSIRAASGYAAQSCAVRWMSAVPIVYPATWTPFGS
jgi:hypothetical protein